MADQEYVTKLLLKATLPNITRDRQRQICWKALQLLGCDRASAWWVLKMNVKLWIRERICGDCE